MASSQIKFCAQVGCEWDGTRPRLAYTNDSFYERTKFCGCCGWLLHVFERLDIESVDAQTFERRWLLENASKETRQILKGSLIPDSSRRLSGEQS